MANYAKMAEEIEFVRQQLSKLVDDKGLLNEQTLSMSRKMDYVLVKFHRMENRAGDAEYSNKNPAQ